MHFRLGNLRLSDANQNLRFVTLRIFLIKDLAALIEGHFAEARHSLAFQGNDVNNYVLRITCVLFYSLEVVRISDPDNFKLG